MLKKITAWVVAGLIFALFAIPAQTALAAETCMVRVNLSTLGAPSTVTVQVNGTYAIPQRPDIVLQSGQNYTISYTGYGLTLSGPGFASIDMGSNFTMQSYMDSAGNVGYLYVRDIARSYRGDMTYYASGYVQLVNRVFIEDYTIGVIRGEMNDNFPLDALRAQAVAARTYAYKRLKSGGTYDIGDTSSDQVYRGFRSSESNVLRAVNDTKGLIVYYGSTIIDTYYSASNGGQVEVVGNRWSSRDAGPWTQMKDDPYDLRNPSSQVDSISVSKTGPIANYSLDQILRQRMGNYYGSILGVQNITLSNPRQLVSGSEASRYYLSATFDLIVPVDDGNYGGSTDYSGGGGGLLGGGLLGGGGSSTGTTGGTVNYTGETKIRSVTISTQTDLLTIVSPSYKLSLFTVVDNGSSFRIEGRRFGHGVGLSQRGAEQMAAEGIDYRTILSFYYPNTTLVDHGFVSATTMGGITSPVTSPTPTIVPGDTPTPAPTALGSGVITASSLNVRAQPSTASARLGSLSRSNTVTIVSDTGDFYGIAYGSTVGFVAKAYVQVVSGGDTTIPPTTVTPTPPPATVQTGKIVLSSSSSNLNVRSGPSTSNSVVGQLKSGHAVTVTSTSGDWTGITAGSVTGYVMSKYIQLDPTTPTIPTTATPTPTPGVILTPPPQTGGLLGGGGGGSNNNGGGLLGGGGSSGGGLIGGGGLLGGGSFITATPSPTPIVTAPPVATPTPAPVAVTGTVKTSGGTVNVRATPSSGGQVIARAANGANLTVIGKSGDWYQISAGSITGYISASLLTVNGTVPDITNVVTPTPTPAATQATIVLSSGSSSLNLRSGPGTTYASAGYLRNGDVVTVGAVSGDWVAVTHNGVSGYVKTSYVSTFAGSAAQGTTKATIRLSSSSATLNLRSGPGTSFNVVGVLSNGTSVTLGEEKGDWVAVSTGSINGYVMKKYLSTSSGSGSTGGSSSEKTTTAATTGNVNLRSKASTSGTVLSVVPKGTSVTLVDKGSEFSKVTYNGKTGYISNKFLKF